MAKNPVIASNHMHNASMTFGKYPVGWYKEAPSSIAPSPEVQVTRRPSNPIAIPRSQSVKKPSVVTPISPISPVICLKCGLHSRPSTADIIETGGCSPVDVRLRSYFSDPTNLSNGQAAGRQDDWSTEQYCEGCCPDTVMPSVRFGSADSGYSVGSLDGQRQRHHHRRRSSLSYGQTSVPEEDDDAGWDCDREIDVKKKSEADRIARKVITKRRRGSKLTHSSMPVGNIISEA